MASHMGGTGPITARGRQYQHLHKAIWDPMRRADHVYAVQTQGQNIRNYTEYLLCRAEQYGATKVDYVRSGEGRLKRLNIDKGLLRETESVQDQIKFLLRCEVRDYELDMYHATNTRK